MQKNDTLDKLKYIKNKTANLDSRLSNLEGKNVEEIPFEVPSSVSTYYDFLSKEDITRINKELNQSLNKGVECDALDYALSASAGIVCGLVDIMFVKTPHEGLAGKASDGLFDQMVKRLAQKVEIKEKIKDGKEIKDVKDRTIQSAIGFLEEKASVCYDQTATQTIKKQLQDGFTETIDHLSTKNHHAKSLAHYPDFIGLIASICNQFTNTSTFLDNSKGAITIVNGTNNNIELQGDTTRAKIFCGIANWFIHCASDVAGSSGSRGNDGLGMGLPIPFTEFFQFCKFGKFSNEKGDWQSLATVLTKVYEEGYDLRHGVATTFPVILNDLLIKVIYVFKQHFYNHVEWKDLISLKQTPTLTRMITVGDGALCLMDLSEAAITSWGNWVVFFSHLNISAWAKLGKQGIKELIKASHRDVDNIVDMQEEIDEEWENLLIRSQKITEKADG